MVFASALIICFIRVSCNARAVVEESSLGHHLLRVERPAFNVRAVAEHVAKQAAGFGLDLVGELELHVVARHRFVDRELVQTVAVVFRSLDSTRAFGHVFGIGVIGSNAPSSGSSAGAGFEPTDAVDTAHEFGRIDDLQVRAGWQRQERLVAHERGGLGERLLGLGHVGPRGRVLACDFVERLLDRSRRCELRHLGARALKVGFRFGEQLLRSLVAGNRVGELARVCSFPSRQSLVLFDSVPSRNAFRSFSAAIAFSAAAAYCAFCDSGTAARSV